MRPTHLLLSIQLMKQSGPVVAGGVLASCEIEIDPKTTAGTPPSSEAKTVKALGCAANGADPYDGVDQRASCEQTRTSGSKSSWLANMLNLQMASLRIYQLPCGKFCIIEAVAATHDTFPD
jgi:hypothetical protein